MDSLNYPSWIKVKPYKKEEYKKTFNLIKNDNLCTVCIEANCPNRYECFSKKTATFMILGDTCTRNCKYCNIKKGIPKNPDKKEPKRIAEAISKLKLDYVVITCVTRDDLKDGGAEHFVEVVKEIRKARPSCKIELLISDLRGDLQSLKKIIDSKPDVLNHNIEVARPLFSKLRPLGDYEISLKILKESKRINTHIKTKSGFMLGFGERKLDIINTLKDLKKAECDIVTIGQYLSPSSKHAKVERYYSPKEFDEIKEKGFKLCIKKMIAGPLVRSSYLAKEVLE